MTTVLLYTLGVVLFVGAILVSIGLHELGHMIPAKAFGGKVTQYFIGFGPTVWSKQLGETECGIKAIPLGGYVKIVGMLPPAAEDLAEEVTYDEEGRPVQRIRRSNTGLFTQLISDARAAEWDLVKPEDADRLFYKMPVWKKVTVMAGGPTVNLLIAFFCFWAVFGLYGQRGDVVDPGQPVLAEVSECVVPYTEGGRACRDDDVVAPAYAAGLRPGDVITSFNGEPIGSFAELRTLIRANEAGDAVIGYERDGVAHEATTTTTVDLRPTSSTDESLTQVGFLGIVPTSHEEIVTGGPIFTIKEMGHMTVASLEALATLPVKVYEVGQAIVGVKDRAQDSPVSIVGGSRFAGEAASAEEPPVSAKAAQLAVLVGGFNLFIGLFNFLPLLPLDGGHIASALWEGLRRRMARLRRRPDPGYVDAAKLLPIAYVMASLFLVMGVVLIVGDLVAPVSLAG